MAALMVVLLAACAQTPAHDVVMVGSEEVVSEAVAEEPEAPEEEEATEEAAEELETLGFNVETSRGKKEAGWYIDNNGDVFYIGKDGEPLTGWQEFSGYWFHFGEDGAAIKGWTKYGDTWYFCDETIGVVTTNSPVQGKYWADANGNISEVGGKMAEGGSRSWTEVSGLDREAFVEYLTTHAFDYLGTRYDSWPCSVPGVGMHCVGFVDRAIFDAGFADGFWNDLRGTGFESYTYNDGNIYRGFEDPYSNENCWHVGGWAIWMNANDVRWVAYRTHEDAMAGAQRGEFQKGDIMIYSTSTIDGYDYSGTEHICFYWGDERFWSLVWESAPSNDNAIVTASEYTMPIYVLTSV